MHWYFERSFLKTLSNSGKAFYNNNSFQHRCVLLGIKAGRAGGQRGSRRRTTSIKKVVAAVYGNVDKYFDLFP